MRRELHGARQMHYSGAEETSRVPEALYKQRAAEVTIPWALDFQRSPARYRRACQGKNEESAARKWSATKGNSRWKNVSI